MGIFKVGKYWRYDFVRGGHRFQGSTRQTNVNRARDVEAKLKSDIALGRFGILPEHETALFGVYMQDTFLAHVGIHAKKRRTYDFYRDRTKRLLRFEPWKTLRLNAIDGAQIERYVSWASKGVAIHTINHDLRTLRKALRLAEEWNLIKKAPKVRLLPGARSRDFVITLEMEAAYLAVAPYPLKQAVILMLDCGLRPEELVSVRKQDIGQCDLLVPCGKSENAHRQLPMTARGRAELELLIALFPDSPYLFPGLKVRHYNRQSLDNCHRRFCRKHGFPPEFELHSCRHTYATRLAESGADVHAIKDLLGHADIRMASRYVHVSQEHLTNAVKRMEALRSPLKPPPSD